MTAANKQKYKDESPLNTICRIRNILHNLDIIPVETWLCSVKGIYSVNLRVPGLKMMTNGKGVTEEYALASAYGEFMERLQNQVIYKHYGFDPETQHHQGFYYSPDEKYVSVEEVLEDPSEWMQIWIPGNAPKDVREKLIRLWTFETPKGCQEDFVSIPLYNLNTDDICYIPVTLLDIFYRSNGMCAGNTPEEALVQGICEDIERYVNVQIVTKKIVPPTVPDEYLSRFPHIQHMIQSIEECGNYKVIVKDCSLGQNFPVVSVIFINQDTQKYFVRFGSHPVFEIALERTLTEIFQGRDIKDMDYHLADFTFINEYTQHLANLDQILIDGRGYYPPEFLGNEFSYPFTEFNDVTDMGNKELLQYLVQLLKDKGYTILIRDVSFLGFPTFRVIIPGITEIVFTNERYIEIRSRIKQIRNIIRNIKSASKKDLIRLLNYLKELQYTNDKSLGSILDVPLQLEASLNQLKTDLFIGAAYYKLGKPELAYEAMLRFVNYMGQSAPSSITSYFKCIRDYFGAKAKGLDDSRIRKRLENIYPINVLEEVLQDMHDPDQVFQYYEQLPCWNCDECTQRYLCSYDKITKIHKNLKQAYKMNQIDQKIVRTFFTEI